MSLPVAVLLTVVLAVVAVVLRPIARRATGVGRDDAYRRHKAAIDDSLSQYDTKKSWLAARISRTLCWLHLEHLARHPDGGPETANRLIQECRLSERCQIGEQSDEQWRKRLQWWRRHWPVVPLVLLWVLATGIALLSGDYYSAARVVVNWAAMLAFIWAFSLAAQMVAFRTAWRRSGRPGEEGERTP